MFIKVNNHEALRGEGFARSWLPLLAEIADMIHDQNLGSDMNRIEIESPEFVGFNSFMLHHQLFDCVFMYQVSRLEEKEGESKKEYTKLHERYTELFKTHMDHMERTKILMGTVDPTDPFSFGKRLSGTPSLGPGGFPSSAAPTPGSQRPSVGDFNSPPTSPDGPDSSPQLQMDEPLSQQLRDAANGLSSPRKLCHLIIRVRV